MLASGDFVTPRLNGVPFLDKPILFYWLAALSMHQFGTEEWALRLPATTMGILGVAIVFALARRVFGKRAGWIAAAVLATSPLYYLGFHFANMDPQVAFWITVCCACLMLGIISDDGDPARRRWFLLAWPAAALGFLTKGLIAIVLPSMIVLTWMLVHRRFGLLRELRWMPGLALFIAIIAPWLLLVQQRNPQFAQYFFVFQHFGRYVGTQFNNEQPAWYYVGLLAAGFLPWSPFVPAAVRGVWRNARDSVERRALSFLLIWASVVVVFFSIPLSKPPGYVLPALAPIALLVGVALARLVAVEHIRERWRHKLRDPFFLFALTTTATAIGMMVYAQQWFASQHTARVAFWLVSMVAIAWISAAILTMWLHNIGRSEIAVGAIALASAIVCGMIIAMMPVRTGRSQEDVGVALQVALRAKNAPVVFYRGYYYTVPIYAKLSEPVWLVDQWDDPNTTSDDNWRLTLWRGSGWRPETRRLFVNPQQLAARLLAAGGGFIIVEPDMVQEAEAMIGAEPRLQTRVLFQDDLHELVQVSVKQ